MDVVPVTRVEYEIDGWGTGELWLDGARLVWHELPRHRPSEAPRIAHHIPTRVGERPTAL